MLRFWALLVETDDLSSEVTDDPARIEQKGRPVYVVRLFLSDGSLEVSLGEEQKRIGEGFVPVLVKRQLVPQPDRVGQAIGEIGWATRNASPGKRCWIGVPDLKLGRILSLYGKHLLLFQADDFTMARLGGVKQLGQPLELVRDGPRHAPASREVRKHRLKAEKALRAAVSQRYEQHQGVVLRFLATLQGVEEDRRFLVLFYPVDETVVVFEKDAIRKGFSGNKFFERSKVQSKTRDENNEPKPLTVDAVHIGEILEIHSFRFHILESDEFTRRYLQEHPQLCA